MLNPCLVIIQETGSYSQTLWRPSQSSIMTLPIADPIKSGKGSCVNPLLYILALRPYKTPIHQFISVIYSININLLHELPIRTQVKNTTNILKYFEKLGTFLSLHKFMFCYLIEFSPNSEAHCKYIHLGNT